MHVSIILGPHPVQPFRGEKVAHFEFNNEKEAMNWVARLFVPRTPAASSPESLSDVAKAALAVEAARKVS